MLEKKYKSGLVLIGAGGHSKSCIEVIEREGKFEIIGLIDHYNDDESNSSQLGYPILGNDSCLSAVFQTCQYALISVGHIKTSEIRKKLYKNVAKVGFHMPAIISPTATISKYATIGSGTIVMNGAIVNAGAVVGENCIINSGALIEHDVRVGDHVHISTGAILNGNVSVGSGTFVGSGVIVREGIYIGENCTISFGLKIKYDCINNSIYLKNKDEK